MKEAAGEANMTVVTIVLIAIVLGVGTLIVTNMSKGIKGDIVTNCAAVGGDLIKTYAGSYYCLNPASAEICEEYGGIYTISDEGESDCIWR